MEVSRREALAIIAGALASAADADVAKENGAKSLFIPGYDAKEARRDPLAARAIPKGYGGPTTSITRLEPISGRTMTAVYPVQGHVVAVDRERHRGVLHTQSRDWFIGFDPETLDMTGVSPPLADGFIGGGHALHTSDGAALLTVERAPYGSYLGDPTKHFGRVTVRDPETLREVGRIGSFGVAPHDIQLLDDGSTVAIANYGSPAPRNCNAGEPASTVEPSLTFVDLRNGQLLDKVVTPAGSPEIRHFAAASKDELIVLRVDQGGPDVLSAALGFDPGPDETQRQGCSYIPAAPTMVERNQNEWVLNDLAIPKSSALRQGLSVAYDPARETFLATYPSTHTLLVTGARGKGRTRMIDLAALGLRYPCGLALDHRAGRYFVAGAFGPVMAFSLEDHQPFPELTIPLRLGRHSHIILA